jgi:hypothetical protein
MNSQPFEESGMMFGPYPDGHCFRIEKSKTYKEMEPDGVKIAELLLLHIQQNTTRNILIIEAKKSAPNLSNDQSKFNSYINTVKNELTGSLLELSTLDKINKELARSKKDEYFDNIREKFTNSLSLFVAMYLRRHPTGGSELPDSFTQHELHDVTFQLILVIKDSEKHQLPNIQEKLKKSLKPIVRTWNLAQTSVRVLSEEGAKKLQIVS